MARVHNAKNMLGKLKTNLFKTHRFSIASLSVFVIIFAVIGGDFIYSSFAATGSATGDINNDGSVNITDLSLLLSSYNQNTTTCATNTNFTCDLSSPSDGIVNIFDLSILLSHYGSSGQSSDCLATNNCYPKPVNSGVGATGVPVGHTPASSCTTSPASGAILTDCLFTNGVTITTSGSGATYRFSEFRGMVTHTGSGTLTVEYSNFGPTSGCQTYDNSFTGGNYVIRFSRFNTHVSEGPRDADNNILIEENFIGPMCSNPGDHADGVQGFGGGTNVKILHNTFDMRTATDTTANVFMADNSLAADVENNLFMGAGYGLRLHNDTADASSLWIAIGNRFVSGSFGFGTFISSNITWTTNCSDNRNVTIDASYNITSVGSIIGC